jgi:hypothetical protein
MIILQQNTYDNFTVNTHKLGTDGSWGSDCCDSRMWGKSR